MARMAVTSSTKRSPASIFWSHARSSSRSGVKAEVIFSREAIVVGFNEGADIQILGCRRFLYAGSAEGCHRGLRRAPASSIPSTISASSAASMASDERRRSLEKVGRKRPFSRRLVHIA
jgi:hypothetical protein